MSTLKSILFITALGLSNAASAQVAQTPPTSAPAPAPVPARATLPTGYLTPETWPDAARILPLPPTTGSAREAVDQGVFRSTRALEGTPRWAMAQADVPTMPDAMLKGFSCAVGVELSAQNAPKLNMLLSRTAIDMGRQVSAVKDVFKRKRPAGERGLRLRPHAKMHKSSALARLQMQAGAVGVCVQKTSEAEAMVAAARSNLAYSEIRAPFAGTILRLPRAIVVPERAQDRKLASGVLRADGTAVPLVLPL